MKSILMSIRPQHVANILNGLKTLEIRKRFPSDYVGWVYIYCTKDTPLKQCEHFRILGMKCANKGYYLNGKVVARFWCDKVEEINIYGEVVTNFSTENIKEDDLLKGSCLSYGEMLNYFDNCEKGYAIHITNLEIFDKPKEISKFRRYCDKHFNWWTIRCLDCKAYTPDTDIEDYCNENKLVLTRAPESWCYVEI